MTGKDWTSVRHWRTMDCHLVETPWFTQEIVELLSDEEYRALQLELAARPDAGAVIPAGGGLRKLRWKSKGRGKRGGIRVIYYYRPLNRRIFLVDVFAKSTRVDLTRRELQLLRGLMEEEEP